MHKAIIAILLVFCCLLCACSKAPKTESERPARPSTARKNTNVLLITIDTLRADYLSCYGRKTISTPNIDALAARGVRCTQAIAQVPLTAPSHASIMTGTYPQIHKVRDMGGFVLDSNLPTAATILGSAGWSTAAFVGAAVLSHYYGMNRGFSVYSDTMKDELGLKKIPGVVAEVRGEVVTRRALEWLEKADRSKPFFLWIHYYDPHFPYDPPEPHRSRYPKDPYSGEVAYADEQVGKLLQSLASHALDSNTLVVLLSDHGESLGEHGEYTHGVFLYDSTVHIPMIFAGPGIPAGREVTQQVRSIDVLPTVTDFLGLPPSEKVQGASLMPALIEGKPTRSNYCYMETLYPKTQMGWSELRAMRTDQWKFIAAPRPELYRLSEDRGETLNIAGKFLADADHLQKKVWEVAGPPKSLERLEPQLVNEERRRELDALGYVSSGRRAIYIDMSGPDPKDRVSVLGVLERASDSMNHDRWSEAVAPLERASREDPTNPLIYKSLKLCYQRLGRFDRMEQTCHRAIRNGVETDDILASLGEVQIRYGNLAKAVEFMEKAAKLNPANLQNMDNLATAYLQLGRQDESRQTLQAVLIQDPRHAMAHNVLGILEIQQGRALEARRHFEQAIEINQDLPEPYMNLGLLAQKAGDAQSAISNYRSFLQRADRVKHREYIPKVKAALAELGATP